MSNKAMFIVQKKTHLQLLSRAELDFAADKFEAKLNDSVE